VAVEVLEARVARAALAATVWAVRMMLTGDLVDLVEMAVTAALDPVVSAAQIRSPMASVFPTLGISPILLVAPAASVDQVARLALVGLEGNAVAMVLRHLPDPMGKTALRVRTAIQESQAA
jgi:hypothetical protein